MQLSFASTFTFGDALFTVLEFAVLFFWIWILVSVMVDIFRSHDLPGWAKAGWILLIVIVPLIGVLIYVPVRGEKMRVHQINEVRRHDAAFREYARGEPATPADDLYKLEDLRDRGVLTDEEFQRAKQKALA